MGYEKAIVVFRCSEILLEAVDSFIEQEGKGYDRAAAILSILESFFENPVYIDQLNAKELRAPLTKTVNLTLPEEIEGKLKKFATIHDTSTSAVIRLAIYWIALYWGKD